METPSLLMCWSCGEPEKNLYSCDTCESRVSAATTGSSHEKRCFCDSCVVQHVRKGHDVKNAKGQPPMVCSAHNNLHSHFCRTCDVTFCVKCLEEHQDHQLATVEERAKEVRKEVFKILTEAEMSEKPVRSKTKSAVNQNERDCLVQLVTREIEELQTGLIGIIDKKYKGQEQKVNKLADNVCNLQQEARSALSADDCELICQHKRLKERFLKCMYDTGIAMSGNSLCENFDFKQVRECFQVYKKSAMQQLLSKLAVPENDEVPLSLANRTDNLPSSPEVKKLILERYSSVGHMMFDNSLRSLTYRLVISRGALAVHEVKSISNQGTVVLGKQLICRPFRKTVQNVFFDHSMTKVIIQSEAGPIDILLAEANGYRHLNLDIQLSDGFICLFIFENEIHQCYWNSNTKTICLTHCNKTFECKTMPLLISSEIFPFLCLLTRECEVIVYDVVRDDFIYVPFIIHGCESIDYVSTLCTERSRHSFNPYSSEDFFLFWSVKSKSVTTFEWNGNGNCNVQKWCWTDPTQSFSPNFCYKAVRCLPAVKDGECNDAVENLRYIFACIECEN
ncbi:uncharacterized protein LOC142352147 [Convolutriloba macropyga]|uniref:uncharacterized protein LOC142352147 n=1 Tax=Convolutriloba macropyga TaxID=536237 RepID=UPI003F52039E